MKSKILILILFGNTKCIINSAVGMLCIGQNISSMDNKLTRHLFLFIQNTNSKITCGCMSFVQHYRIIHGEECYNGYQYKIVHWEWLLVVYACVCICVWYACICT